MMVSKSSIPKKKPSKSPKEIWRRSCRIFKNLVPDEWACRDQQDQEDTGIDYEIEPFNENNSGTGLIFKVQVKGELKVKFNKGKRAVFRKLEIDKIDYLLNKIRIPVILVLTDLDSNCVWWYGLSGSITSQDSLKRARKIGKKTTSIVFSSENEFPSSKEALLKYVADARVRMSVEDLTTVDLSSLKGLPSCEEKEDVLRALGDNVANAELDRIFDFIDQKEFDKAKGVVESIFVNPLRSWNIRYDVAFVLQQIEIHLQRRSSEQYSHLESG